jgi:hypothetical protein
MPNNTQISNQNFSPNLFWDIDVSTLDLTQNKRFIIQRVLELGTLSDWKIIKNLYGTHTIGSEMQKVRSLDSISLSFTSMISGIKKENFRCYTLKQSTPQHWNF